MSHSQFHCTARVYLDMHGLSFETSICYWQDQPGSRHPRRTRGRPARRHALPTLTAPALSPTPTRGSGITDATVAAWQRRQRRRRPRTRRLGQGRRRASAGRRHHTGPGGRPFPRRRGQGAGTAAQLFFSPLFRSLGTRRRRHRAPISRETGTRAGTRAHTRTRLHTASAGRG